MIIDRRGLLAATAAAAAAGVLPGRLAAQETIRLTVASSHPTTLPWVGVIQSHVVGESNARLEAAGSPSRIDWTESWGGALYSFDETLEAVGDGLTDLGWVGTLWEESKMPLQNVTYYTPFVTDDLPLQLAVLNDLHERIPALSEAWERQDQVFLGASGIETYHLLTREPFESFGQLRGMRIIAAGSVGNFLEGTGAAAVNSGLPDFYSNLGTGVADGVLISLSGASSFRLYEPAPYVTRVGIGSQMTGALSANRRVWRGLPENVQTALRDLGREYSDIHAQMLLGAKARFETQMTEAGATIGDLDPAERQRWVEALPDLARQWAETVAQDRSAAVEVLTAYIEAVRAAGASPARDWSIS